MQAPVPARATGATSPVFPGPALADTARRHSWLGDSMRFSISDNRTRSDPGTASQAGAAVTSAARPSGHGSGRDLEGAGRYPSRSYGPAACSSRRGPGRKAWRQEDRSLFIETSITGLATECRQTKVVSGSRFVGSSGNFRICTASSMMMLRRELCRKINISHHLCIFSLQLCHAAERSLKDLKNSPQWSSRWNCYCECFVCCEYVVH